MTDTAEALFEVDDYENFVHVQTESALRNLATSLPVRRPRRRTSCRCAATRHEVAEQLQAEIQDRLEKAGVEVIEARISHLAYAPEIANAMLRRQQANAIIAARTRIVEGAVGMVEMALDAALGEADRRARRGAQGADGEQPARRALQRARDAAGGQHRHAVPVAARQRASRPDRWPSASRSCSASIPQTFAALQRWAADDLRSLNGQMEFLLRRALRDAGRLPSARGVRPAASSSTKPGERESANPERSAVAPEKA